MFFLKAAFCRVFQAAFRLSLPVLPYREPEIIPSCADLRGVFKKERVRSVLIVTDKGIVKNGMGAYHGKAGFDAFSHYKSIVDKKTWLDLPMRYQPYKSRIYAKLLHMFLK